MDRLSAFRNNDKVDAFRSFDRQRIAGPARALALALFGLSITLGLSSCSPSENVEQAVAQESIDLNTFGSAEFNSEGGMTPAEAIMKAYGKLVGIDSEQDAPKFYDEITSRCDYPTMNVAVIKTNAEGKITDIVYANHWELFFDLVDDNNPNSLVTDEINNMFEGDGLVVVTDSSNDGRGHSTHRQLIKNIKSRITPTTNIRGKVYDNNDFPPKTTTLEDYDALTSWMGGN